MSEKILIIDDDLDTIRLVGLMLQRHGYQISAAVNGPQGIDKAVAESPDLILLDIMMPEMDGYEVARRLRENAQTANIPVLMFTAKTQMDDKVVGFEAGADDYLTKPTHPSELHEHVKTLLSRSTKDKKEPPPISKKQRAYLVGVLSARGGLGVSTLAINLAGSLYTKTKEAVIVAELTPGLGTLGLDMGITDLTGLTDLLSDEHSTITSQRVKDSLVMHDSGLQLLAASSHPRDAQLTGALSQYAILVKHLSSMARFVILDFGAGLPPFVQKLLRECDESLVVVEGFTNSVIHTRALIDDMLSLGLESQQISAVLNHRIRSELLLSLPDVQSHLRHPILYNISPAPELFFQAMVAHTPMAIRQPESLPGQQFMKIASSIIERESLKK